MRRWMVVAGLAAALLAAVLLVQRARRPAAPVAPHPAPEGAQATPDAPHPAPEAAQATPGAPHPVPIAPRPGSAGAAATGEEMDQEPPDENSRLVMTYPITMKRLQAYVAAVKEIRVAGEKDPALMTRLRQRGPADEGPTGMGARLGAIPPVKAILDRHGLVGLDLVIMPQVVRAGQAARAQEQEGRPLPPDQVNPASLALYRADLPKMDALSKAFMADLRVLSGR